MSWASSPISFFAALFLFLGFWTFSAARESSTAMGVLPKDILRAKPDYAPGICIASAFPIALTDGMRAL